MTTASEQEVKNNKQRCIRIDVNCEVTMMRTLIFFLIMLPAAFLKAQHQPIDDSWESLRSRPYPQWFKDAKLGVFIHWGVYSVPSYGGPESYAEWYLRGLQAGAQIRVDFMRDHYGKDFSYEDFAPLWKAELFDPEEWAEIFERAGAGYIILVSKHHDGFCLWPSEFAPGWNSVDVGPGRDIVGELGEAVRKRDIRFGHYYSLPEWNHSLHRWYIDPHDSIHDYVEQHMIPQLKNSLVRTNPTWFLPMVSGSIIQMIGLHARYRSMQQYVAYTHNHGNLYAISFEWPQDEFVLPIPEPIPGTVISLLGREGSLQWKYENQTLIIDTSPVKYHEMPGHDAWTFKIENYE